MPHLQVSSPVGPLTVHESDGAITALRWEHSDAPQTRTALLAKAEAQLAAYFNDKAPHFDLPFRIDASAFQQAVCDVMSAIPFGETRTYGEIAKDLGVPAQAVGQACGGNPIPVLIPCHRVLGANTLGGFSGGTGIDTKVWLLRHEQAAGLLI